MKKYKNFYEVTKKIVTKKNRLFLILAQIKASLLTDLENYILSVLFMRLNLTN